MKSFLGVIATCALICYAQTGQAEMLYGRDALDQARALLDRDNTYTSYFKPRSNVIVVRDYDSHTHKPLVSAALVNDKKALDYYATHIAPDSQGAKPKGGKSKAKKSKAKKSKGKRSESISDGTRAMDERSVDPNAAPGIFARNIKRTKCGKICSNNGQCNGTDNCKSCIKTRRTPASNKTHYIGHCKP